MESIYIALYFHMSAQSALTLDNHYNHERPRITPTFVFDSISASQGNYAGTGTPATDSNPGPHNSRS